ncbi:MAG TPA: DUF6188 family protein [Acidimicrobiales bacterium]|nr:DUF6188 family protein [Acidimicrobiales bacterium]
MDAYDLSALVGSQVRRVAFDDRVSLLLVDSAHREQRVAANLWIEAAIAFRDSEGAEHEVRPGVTASLSPMLRLLRCCVTSVSFDGRELAIGFDDGSRFSVFTGERYEAWDLRGLGVPNLIAGPWCLTDESPLTDAGDRAAPGDPWLAAPPLDLPVYGLSSRFGGRRALGLWDSNLGEQFIGVFLDHGDVGEEVLVTVGTVAKSSPLVAGTDDLVTGTRVTGFEAALSQALFGLLQLEMPTPGEERAAYLREKLPEMDQLALDLDSSGWERSTINVAGAGREALVHHLGRSWGAAVDVDGRIALALWGRGMDPSDLDVVAIDEIDAYPASATEES